jgi:hypothetical protein
MRSEFTREDRTMTKGWIAAFATIVLLGGAAPGSAQETTGEAGRAAALDRLLGANADLPRPDPAQATAWLPAPLPPWLAAQPYRQQPLFATVPIGGTVGGRVRTPGGP